MPRRIDPGIYDRDYFLSDFLEGYREYLAGGLSSVKAKQLQMLRLSPGTRLLEVGFGRGELLYHCARAGAHVVGIDYSQDALEIARGLLDGYSHVDLCLANCRELPFADRSFDRVFSGDVIEHLGYDDAVRMLSEMYRVLRPEGLLLIHTTPNTIFRNVTYPMARPILKRINSAAVAAIDHHLESGPRFHVDEYNPFILKKIARRAGLCGAHVWVDEDLLRSSKHIYTRPFATHPIVRFIGSLGRYRLVRLFLGNDIYLQCTKP